MTALEWLVWVALTCLVFWAYQAIDLTQYWRRPACRKPVPKPVPHWARPAPPPRATPPKHGRHAKSRKEA